MPEINDEVLEMVRRQLRRDPPPDTRALYGRATHIDDAVFELSLRQFNALYVLRVKREQKREGADAAEDG